MDQHAFALAVRWLHVGAMAVALGGSALVALQAAGRGAEGRDRVLVGLAARFEWAFWISIGVLVMTGVGNLGAFGPTPPVGPTAWGATFVTKLAGVATLATLSVPRTIAIARLLATDRPLIAARVVTTVRWLYGGTALTVAAILALAVGLAHG